MKKSNTGLHSVGSFFGVSGEDQTKWKDKAERKVEVSSNHLFWDFVVYGHTNHNMISVLIVSSDSASVSWDHAPSLSRIR